MRTRIRLGALAVLILLILTGAAPSLAAETCSRRGKLDVLYTFRIPGTSVGRDFKDATRSVPIDYKKDWEAVVEILEANGASFSRESPEYKRFSEPPKKGE